MPAPKPQLFLPTASPFVCGARQLVQDAFQMAWRQYQPVSVLLFHSDRGSQDTSYEFQRLLQVCQVEASMIGAGNCYDNAVAESFFSHAANEKARADSITIPLEELEKFELTYELVPQQTTGK